MRGPMAAGEPGGSRGARSCAVCTQARRLAWEAGWGRCLLSFWILGLSHYSGMLSQSL